MDIEDATDTSDSQTVLAFEFNNQATLNKEKLLRVEGNHEVNGLDYDWDETVVAEGSAISLPIPLPPPQNCSSTPKFSESDATLGDDFEALFSSNDTHAGDMLDSKAEAGVCGLKNLGNTCFMSTGVQCLIATPALVHCLLHQPTVTPDKSSLTSHLSQLTYKMWSGQYSAIQPSDFKDTLGTHYPQFKDFRQHDCQEFLALLLDGLHEHLNSSTIGSKLQDILVNDYCLENSPKKPSETVPNGLCKDSVPSNNAYEDKKDNLSTIILGKNESTISRSPKSDKKINNCVINDIAICTDIDSKLPLLLNKNHNDTSCENTVISESILPVKNKIKDSPANILNNSSPRLSGYQDIIKDAKTSNVNVLVSEQEANNEIRFDSDKFPKSEKVRRESFNFNSFHLYQNNVMSGKRGKSTVTHFSSAVDFREGLDLKRLKMQLTENVETDIDGDSLMDCDREKNHRMEDERKHRSSSRNLDKNYRMECERRRRDSDDPGPSSAYSNELVRPELDQDAEIHWQKHLAAHQSVIVDTFQGQYKSTVVCSTCSHVSVTYEPFMYLSVPLPHAMERQLSVTFVSGKEQQPVQYMLTLNKRDSVGYIKDQLLHLIEHIPSSLLLAEVLDCHISKFLDESLLVPDINCTIRDIYAFEVSNFSRFSGLEKSFEDVKSVGCETTIDLTGDACTICLEEKDSNMSRHLECSSILCDSCIVRSNEDNKEDILKCPICRNDVIPEENLMAVGTSSDIEPSVRMLIVSLVFRLDTMGYGNKNNNMKTVQLFGHPRLLWLPSTLLCQQLHEAVASLIPYSLPYKILLVDGQGHRCSRCMFNDHCRGCPIDLEGPLVLRAGDSLAAMFVDSVPELPVIQHSSMQSSTINKPLSLYDCIQAFSQSETLDEHNPWYCPNCKKNQCATKTLSVWRYPNYLIIYLKRFVFQDCVSTKIDDKVTFPLCGLNLSPGCSLYDLYACVCHVGGVSAGHYTAYTQHPHSGEWHYYNDDCVTKQSPQEEDYSKAYILFYKSRGADLKNEDFNSKAISLKSEAS